jgi:hypothetical protein
MTAHASHITKSALANAGDFDQATVSKIGAINCHIDAPTRNSFAIAITGEKDIANASGWKKAYSRHRAILSRQVTKTAKIKLCYA